MRVILCDRCGARIEREDTVGFVGLTRKDINTGNLIGKTDFEDWDICDDCMKQIEEFVRMKPAPEASKIRQALVNRVIEATDARIARELQEEEPCILPTEDDPFDTVEDKPKATIKKPMPTRITPEQIEQIKTMATEGHSVNTIAELVGVSSPTVRKYKKELEDETMDSEE